ncbi:tetratricopeptide repeat protein [Actinoplanes derwentensis]|uniref:tetratricopeptide repeat protein n=1 Tax=Actinoplanes derwentensis TaxID=113562 RepID=UPI0012FE2D22|nr:tetratricopeptide repeat protein [Actinoplanes derwentensis]GID90539.1 hypothetical protein Ade03nite_94630 [Actinoplanes derwentensis]
MSVAAAASLSGDTATRIQPLLTELAAAGLVEEHRLGRFTCHDLLRAFAGELAGERSEPVESRTAIHRLLDHYLHTAHRAADLQFPSRTATTLAPAQPGVSIGALSDGPHGAAWFTAEHENLTAAVRYAAAHRFDTHAWQLTWSLATYLDRRGHWTDLHLLAVEATEAGHRLHNDDAQARSLRLQARAQLRLGDPYAAADLLSRALAFDTGAAARGHAYYALVEVAIELGDTDGAQAHLTRALDEFRKAGDAVWQANVLSATGWLHVQARRYRQAVVVCSEALALQQRVGTPQEQASSLDTLGLAHHRLGDLDEATGLYDRAIESFEQAGDLPGLAATLTRRADTHASAGHPTAAHADRERAAGIQEQLRLA